MIRAIRGFIFDGRQPFFGICLLAALGWLWFLLLNHLRIEWTVNPQYAYGWAVPFLCGYLFWRSTHRTEDSSTPAPRVPPLISHFAWIIASLLYAPTRLIQEANPDWRLVSWSLAAEVVTISLSLIWLASASRWPSAAESQRKGVDRLDFAMFVFPILFFLVAVPWPTVFEGPFIQQLTRTNASLTIELLNLAGIPALQRGNVIEISTGLVGIDDACSGIRSFQATLMISLFLGALYRLTRWRRLTLVLCGFAMSFVFNVARTLLLVTVAAKQGLPAISRWHDPAGVTILVGCFLGLWLVGLWLARTQSRKQIAEIGEAKASRRSSPVEWQFSPSSNHHAASFRLVPFALAGWLLLVEVGTQFWYRSHERQLTAAVDWQPAFPSDENDYQRLPISENAQRILRFDSGQNVAWNEPDGSRWQLIFLHWNGGRVAAHLARNHTPEVCLTAAGHELTEVSDLRVLTIRGVTLPFRRYTFANNAQPLFVFYCLREDRARDDGFITESLTFASRLAAVGAGRRNLGQRSLEVAIWGQPNAAAAEAALRHQLEKILTVK